MGAADLAIAGGVGEAGAREVDGSASRDVRRVLQAVRRGARVAEVLFVALPESALAGASVVVTPGRAVDAPAPIVAASGRIA